MVVSTFVLFNLKVGGARPGHVVSLGKKLFSALFFLHLLGEQIRYHRHNAGGTPAIPGRGAGGGLLSI